jgi:hypothetical protein
MCEINGSKCNKAVNVDILETKFGVLSIAMSTKCLGVRVLTLPIHPTLNDVTSVSTNRRQYHCKLISRFDEVKSIVHPNLCEYADMAPCPLFKNAYTVVCEHYTQSIVDEAQMFTANMQKASKQGWEPLNHRNELKNLKAIYLYPNSKSLSLSLSLSLS